MLEVKAPQPYTSTSDKTIFLAGSIEMGKAIDWQTKIAEALVDSDYTLLNPRRDDWNSDWEQSIHNQNFMQQVNWEIDGIEFADTIVFYFDPNTISPITLLELGKATELVKQGKKVYVCCGKEYFRYGNVEVMCYRSNITLLSSLDALIDMLKAITLKQDA